MEKRTLLPLPLCCCHGQSNPIKSHPHSPSEIDKLPFKSLMCKEIDWFVCIIFYG